MSKNENDYVTKKELAIEFATFRKEFRKEIKQDMIEVMSEIATQILTVMAERFEQVDRRFDRLEARMDAAEERAERTDAQLLALQRKSEPQAEINHSFDLRISALEAARR